MLTAMNASTVLVAAALLIAGIAIGAVGGFAIARSRTSAPGLAALLSPAADAMARVESQLRQVERDRIEAYAGLREQVAALHRTSGELGAQAGALAGALRSPQVRGRWGEVQLQRVVELAGMVEHCDFDTQVSVTDEDGGARPDMIVRLAGGRNIPVDAKAPMAAWLRACEVADAAAGGRWTRGGGAAAAQPGPDLPGGTPSADSAGGSPRTWPGNPDEQRRLLLAQHARAVRAHVDALASRSYWRLFHPAPEFVVMFVPGEAFLDAALSAEPGLAEYAFERRVVIATPSTLIALLRTVAFTWRQERLSASAEQVHALGRELYRRLTTFSEHLGRVGGALDRAVTSYNAAVRSLDSRVLVGARRFADLGVTGDELPAPDQVHAAVAVAPDATESEPTGGPRRTAPEPTESEPTGGPQRRSA